MTMDLSSKTTVKEILGKHQISPQKKLGQNFLINQQVVDNIVDATEISPEDTILEIGPGIGTITQKLCQKAKKVIAIEKDPKMVEILKETLKEFKNVEIIHGDILDIASNSTGFFAEPVLSDSEVLRMTEGVRMTDGVGITAGQNYKVVGSLPFYIAAPIIRQFLEISNKKTATISDDRRILLPINNLPKEMVLVVQKEVGKRICGRDKMNILAVAVQFYSEPKIIRYISKRAFFPQPKVDSALIKITNILPTSHEYREPKFNQLFFKILKAGFAHPRKQLIGNLSKELNLARDKTENWLLKNNIQPSQRAETLGVQDWINLTKIDTAVSP